MYVLFFGGEGVAFLSFFNGKVKVCGFFFKLFVVVCFFWGVVCVFFLMYKLFFFCGASACICEKCK